MVVGDINYLGTIPLGRVNTFRTQKTSQIIPVPLPSNDSGESQAYDMLGVIAYIDIEGTFTGTFETINGYIHDIFQYVDGNQNSSVRLYSPFVNLHYTGNIRKQGNIGVTTSYSSGKLVDSTAQFLSWGVSNDDIVKNLTTGDVSLITSRSDTTITLADAIFQSNPSPYIGIPYAVTAWINVKVLDFSPRWELPGLGFCRYSLKILQVK